MKMIDTPCPHCQAPTMPAPPRRGRNVWATCPACHERARAKFSDTLDGKTIVEYIRPRHMRRTVVIRVGAELGRLLRYAGAEQAALDFLRGRVYNDLVTMPYKS